MSPDRKRVFSLGWPIQEPGTQTLQDHQFFAWHHSAVELWTEDGGGLLGRALPQPIISLGRLNIARCPVKRLPVFTKGWTNLKLPFWANFVKICEVVGVNCLSDLMTSYLVILSPSSNTKASDKLCEYLSQQPSILDERILPRQDP